LGCDFSGKIGGVPRLTVMLFPLRRPRLLGWLSIALVASCGQTSDPPMPRADASPAAAEAGAAIDAGSDPDASTAADATGTNDSAPPSTTKMPPAVCIEEPTPRAGQRSVIPVTVEPTYAGKPMVFGEPFFLPGGGLLTLSNLRFYLSDLALTKNGEEIPVDIVGADGKPAAYNVDLVSADPAADLTFRIAAPAGDYTGASFVFGLNDACNGRSPSGSKPPLTGSSQMTWPPPFGFLFLRYEATLAGATGANDKDGPLTKIAMGGLPGSADAPSLVNAPTVKAAGAFQISAAGGKLVLRLALDQVFAAVAMPADLNLVPIAPLPEMVDGEHLRQNATKVPIFTIAPAP
jgi:hypothetical protein